MDFHEISNYVLLARIYDIHDHQTNYYFILNYRFLHFQVLIDLAAAIPISFLIKCIFWRNFSVCSIQYTAPILIFAISSLDLVNGYLSLSQSYHYFKRTIKHKNETFSPCNLIPYALIHILLIGFQLIMAFDGLVFQHN